MILTEEEIDELISGEWTPRKVLARDIEQAILDKLQDKLKNSDRYEWLRMQYMEVEFVTKNRSVTFIESFETSEEDAVFLDKVIDSAMGEE